MPIPVVPMTPAALLPTGPLRRIGTKVTCLHEIDSTNSAMMREARQLPDGAVLFAEFQTAGRGRFSRRWSAPAHSSILLSILLREPAHSPLIAQITMIAARAMCQSIRDQAGCDCRIRWPNDLLIQARKVGGVLAQTQTALNPQGREVVVGIGVNCFQRNEDFPPEIRSRATSLAIVSDDVPRREALAADFLARFDEEIAACHPPRHSSRNEQTLDLAADHWLAYCADVGKDITLRVQNKLVRGTVLGCTLTGDLLLRNDDGTEIFIEASTASRVEASEE
ncbi:MAG: biotin--[acetyl-CoA-carboxylase] ligase [Phycisphaerae bacterium]